MPNYKDLKFKKIKFLSEEAAKKKKYKLNPE